MIKEQLNKVLLSVITALTIAGIFWIIGLENRLTRIEIQLQILASTVGTINVLKEMN